MSVGYAITNILSGLAATAFTWSSGYTTARSRLNDGVQDELALGSASAQASGQYLQVDLGSAQTLVGIALLNHNLGTGSCAVEIQCASDPAFPVSPSTNVAKDASTINTSAPNEKDTILQFPGTYSRRYWRIIVTHSGTKTLQIGEVLFLTSITTLSRSPIYGLGEDERFVLNRNESPTGHMRSTYLAGPIRTKRFSFKDMRGTSELGEVMGMWRATRGGNANMLWIDSIESISTAASAEGQACLWGKLQPDLGWTQPDFNLFDPGGLVLVGQGREVGS